MYKAILRTNFLRPITKQSVSWRFFASGANTESKGPSGPKVGQTVGWKKKKEEPKAPKAVESEGDFLTEAIRLSTRTPKAPPRSPEQAAEEKRIVDTYAKMTMFREQALRRDLKEKAKLAIAAVEQLPPELKEAAMVPDLTPAPKDRWIPTYRVPPTFPPPPPPADEHPFINSPMHMKPAAGTKKKKRRAKAQMEAAKNAEEKKKEE